LTSNRIVNNLSQGRTFYPKIFKSHDFWIAGNKKHLYKLRTDNGATVLSINLEGGLGSNIVMHNNMIICWDIKRGMIAFDSRSGNIMWSMKSDYKGAFVKLILDEGKIYFNDGRLRSISAEDGALFWENRTDELVTRNNNLILIQNYLITGFSHNEDAVVALIDKSNGDIVCNGFHMPDHVGFDRYTFFDKNHQSFFYAREGGGLGYKIVRLQLKK
jgi:outer membrane protein assembly factor BamB